MAMNDGAIGLRTVLRFADGLLKEVVIAAEKIMSTPSRDSSAYPRQKAMEALASTVEQTKSEFEQLMIDRVPIKDLHKIVNSLKAMQTSARIASQSKGGEAWRSLIANDMAVLKELVGSGCRLESHESERITPLRKTEPFNEGSEYYTPRQVADLLQVHPQTIARHFAKYPGVVDLAVGTQKRGKRPYRTLRIPRGVLFRYLHEHKLKP